MSSQCRFLVDAYCMLYKLSDQCSKMAERHAVIPRFKRGIAVFSMTLDA